MGLFLWTESKELSPEFLDKGKGSLLRVSLNTDNLYPVLLHLYSGMFMNEIVQKSCCRPDGQTLSFPAGLDGMIS